MRKVKKILKNQALIFEQLDEIFEKENEMSEQLDLLEVQVAETIGAEESAIILLEGISERLTELAEELAVSGVDNAKVLALRDELDASEARLAEAVAANQLPE
jgi:hypothetical protein